MATQSRKLQSDQLKAWKRFPLLLLVFCILLLVLGISSIVVGALSNWQYRTTITISSSIFFISLACIFSFLQYYVLPEIFKDKSAVAKKPFRGILGIPPLTDPKIIIPRREVIDDLCKLLLEADTGLIVLNGIGGVGKSTLAALILERIEKQRQTPHSPFTDETVWLTIDSQATIIDLIGTLFQVFKKPIQALDDMTLLEQIKVLQKVMNTTKQSRLLILDQFENLLNPQPEPALASGSGIYKLIEMLTQQKSRSRILLVTRNLPQEYCKRWSHFCEYHVEGLTTIEGTQLLKQQGLQVSSDDELHVLVDRYEGHPLTLTLLSSLVHSYHLNLSDLFYNHAYTDLLVRAIARALLDDIYTNWLSEVQQKLLFAFAIYRKPVPLSIVQETLKDVSLKELYSALDGLLSQSLLTEMDRKRYRLHNIVAEYVKYYFLEKHRLGDGRPLQINYNLTSSLRKEETIIQTLGTMSRSDNGFQSLIEAIWHFCQAEQWRKAYELMEREKGSLLLWRRNTLLELFQRLLPLDKWNAELGEAVCVYYHIGLVYADLGNKGEALKYYNQSLKILREGEYQNRQGEGRTLNDLGRVYSALGKKDQALKCLEEALEISREESDRKWEVKALNNLGLVYNDLGKREDALNSLKKALMISREIADHRGEGRTLNNLGQIYTDLGEKERAEQYYKQALSIRQEAKDFNGESTTLRNLGLIYADLGRRNDALQYLERALHINRETADRWGEGITINSLGRIYADLGKTKEALEYLEGALHILQEVGNPWEEGRALRNLVRLYWILGKKEDAQSYLEDALKLSRKVGDRKGEGRTLNYRSKIYDTTHQREAMLNILKQALSILRDMGDQKGEGWTLHNLGLVYLKLTQQNEALQYFLQALRIRRSVVDHRGEGWTLYNIGMLSFSRENYDLALACFLSAEDIFNNIDVEGNVNIQSYIDKIRKEVGEGQFTQVKLDATQIIEKALNRSKETK